MGRYRDHVAVWIIDNEPELVLGGYQPTPEECVTFTRIAWEELHELGIEDRCRIESPPVKALNSDYLRRMLEAGLGAWCHVIGTHGYNDQIDDAKIRYPWDQLKAAGIRSLPVGISESGVIAAWAPTGYEGGAEAWRAVFHRQLRVQAKAFGYEYALLFDLDRWRQREQDWRIATFADDGAGFEQIEPIWTTVRDSWGRPQAFANGGFEAPEDGLGTWFVRHPARAAFPVELRRVSFPREAAIARSGSGCCRMSLAGHRGDLVVRQVADLLIPGRAYRVDRLRLPHRRHCHLEGTGLRSTRRPGRGCRRHLGGRQLGTAHGRGDPEQCLAGRRAAQQGHRHRGAGGAVGRRQRRRGRLTRRSVRSA